MARAAEKKPCAKCQKGAGIAACHGCQQSFCTKHIIEHRQELAMEMDHIGQEHDSLRRDLIQEDGIHPLLLRINEWEQESIMKIRVAADTARANLRQLLNKMKSNVEITVEKIADELRTYRESDEYTENDLARWSGRLTDARKLLETPSTIRIVEDVNTSLVVHSIKVLEQKDLHISPSSTQASKKSPLPSKELLGSTQEVFSKAMNSISLSGNGLVATLDQHGMYETIFGKNIYRFGVHHIHFRIENKTNDNFFFGIVTSSQNLIARIFNTPSANGWWGFDVPVIDGTNQEHCGKKILQIGDVVKLTLDCDKRRIRFENYRTTMIVQSPVNLIKCPFPWKLAISLSRPQDCLRILW